MTCFYSLAEVRQCPEEYQEPVRLHERCLQNGKRRTAGFWSVKELDGLLITSIQGVKWIEEWTTLTRTFQRLQLKLSCKINKTAYKNFLTIFFYLRKLNILFLSWGTNIGKKRSFHKGDKTDFIKLTITIPRKQQKEPNLNSNDYVDYNPRTGHF